MLPEPGRSRLQHMFAIACVAMIAFGCGQPQLQVPSPSGEQIAEVRSHWTLDPPSESLWIRSPGEAPRRLARLAEDSEWCEGILWAPDSARVAFLVNGVRLDLYDVREAELVGRFSLVQVDGYPGSREARDVRFARDCKSVEFHDCRRSRPDWSSPSCTWTARALRRSSDGLLQAALAGSAPVA